jgi:DNA-binding transcriptional LysR family regulator
MPACNFAATMIGEVLVGKRSFQILIIGYLEVARPGADPVHRCGPARERGTSRHVGTIFRLHQKGGDALDLRRLDLNLLSIFKAVLEAETLTSAAAQLNLSQPTVSAGLAKLRTLMGDELFVRSNGRMLPTPRALQMKEPLSRVFQSIQSDILSAAGFDAGSDTSAFTICLSDIGELEFLPRLMQRLAVSAPGVSIRSVICDPKTLSEAMDRGEIDIAIGYFPDLKTAVFNQQVLFTHGYSCIVRRDHPIIRDGLTVAQFEQIRHLNVSQDTRILDVVEQALSHHGIERQVALTVSHFVNVPILVAQSDFIATIPKPLASNFAGTYPLSIFEPPFAIPKLEIKQVWHRRFHNSARLAWLRGLITNMSQNKPSL